MNESWHENDVDADTRLDDKIADFAEAQARLAEFPGVAELALVERKVPPDVGKVCGSTLIAYVVPALDKAAVSVELKQTWQQIYGELANDSVRDPNFDTSGWNSSLTGAPYPDAEMQEYVETTVNLMRENSPQSVLDIGCGTGMPLLRVAPHCRRYVGLDQSERTIDNLAAAVKQAGLAQVTLGIAEATDTRRFGGGFDLVVCSSVSQHFPGVDYLSQVLRGAKEAVTAGGRVIITDVRDFSLETEFHSSVVCSQAHVRTPRDVLRARVQRRRSQERELMIDPRWFPVELRGSESVVEVRPRRGYCRNETTAFHYDVIIHSRHSVELVHIDRWFDWLDDCIDLARLADMMRRGPEAFAIRAVPNARTQAGIVFAAQIFGEPGMEGYVRPASGATCGVEPDDIIALGQAHGYDCHLSRINARAGGGFDMAMLRHSTGSSDTKLRIPVFEDVNGISSPRSLSTDPRRFHILTTARTSLLPELRRFAACHLSERQRPSAYLVVPELPLKGGRLHVAALPMPRSARTSGSRSHPRPEWWIAGDGPVGSNC